MLLIAFDMSWGTVAIFLVLAVSMVSIEWGNGGNSFLEFNFNYHMPQLEMFLFLAVFTSCTRTYGMPILVPLIFLGILQPDVASYSTSFKFRWLECM